MEDPPRKPDSVPKYVADGVLRQDEQTLEDLRNWIEDLIELDRGREPDLEDFVDEDEELVETREIEDERGTVVLKLISCGKDSCSSCPHGPYAYRAYWEDGATRTEYIGRASDLEN